MQATPFERALNGYYDRSLPRPADAPGAVPGSVDWWEHVKAWEQARALLNGQTAERMAERGGFDWGELCVYLGRYPTTWLPRTGSSE